ncbi:hypothetical protein I7I53_10092 [Histoplasma capsulatum var. duboisii H88]|uniref:Uncharacterized protein n=1 Tax=Ajellomyces capsulatus (strain H88) TaxID=544711 RepID=A0A8A1LB67_AJEC8|nr:hypothetical protein I7I53_10092 [Histoplasma capsulatum var. duboisii H88]
MPPPPPPPQDRSYRYHSHPTKMPPVPPNQTSMRTPSSGSLNTAWRGSCIKNPPAAKAVVEMEGVATANQTGMPSRSEWRRAKWIRRLL